MCAYYCMMHQTPHRTLNNNIDDKIHIVIKKIYN